MTYRRPGLISSFGHSIAPDGAAYHYSRPGLPPDPTLCIHETNNEIEQDSSDLIAQAECCYVAICCSEEVSVRDVLFADQIISQRLATIYAVPSATTSGRSPVVQTTYRVARFFRALKIFLLELDDYYTCLTIFATPQTPPGKPPYIGPHFIKFTRTDGSQVTLEYTERLSANYPAKVVFLALADTGSGTKSTVVVKFTYEYSLEGHKALPKWTRHLRRSCGSAGAGREREQRVRCCYGLRSLLRSRAVGNRPGVCARCSAAAPRQGPRIWGPARAERATAPGGRSDAYRL
ncbi:uncharacterized protein PHACADRAFT_30101 [Phanerochaete carnosa HHB-10118-sp]|uniref:Uncharacterized protein n=1 Tax=Phanerochaete carnosa (strain HHB-10118-sp) TaxID=650164 RepID=K5WRH4_PHACS|nr:uncharacterized protein PHACADRAFT_30101 [Phanerochaete carnosa HHB-10118-sp]EKM52982.1 hypothetical protein PHACADRAFT_30101 [Phanerochaete carnosa HHB-10118-sp]